MNKTMLFHKFPVIESEHLILNQITAYDLDDLYALCSNETLYRYSASKAQKNKAIVYNMISQFEREFTHEKAIYLAIRLKNSKQHLIGMIEVFDFQKKINMVTIGYILNEPYWGHGYATESVKSLVHFLFTDCDINRIQALVLHENEASKHVLLHNHFTNEGTIRECMYWEQLGIVSIDVFSLLKKEYH